MSGPGFGPWSVQLETDPLMKYLLLFLPFALFASAIDAHAQTTPSVDLPDAYAAERLSAAEGDTRLDALFGEYYVVTLDANEIHVQLEAGHLGLNVSDGPALEADVRSAALRSPGYRLLSDDGKSTKVLARGAGAPDNYRAADGERQHTSLTVASDFIMGRIQAAAGREYYVEPLRHFVDGAAADAFVVYAIDAIRSTGQHDCGVNAIEAASATFAPPSGPESVLAASGACVKIDLALASDHAMFQHKGSVAATEAYVEAVINDISNNYDDEFGYDVQYTIIEQYVSTSTSSALENALTASAVANDVLANFVAWSQSGDGFTQDYDLASLWVRRDLYSDDGGVPNYAVAGVAYKGGVCLDHARYSLIEDFAGAEDRRLIVAHEFGHNFDMPHVNDASKIMSATFGSSGTQSTTWAASSIAKLEARIDSRDCGLGTRALVGSPHAEPAIASTLCLNSATPLDDEGYRAPTSWSWSAPGGTLGSATAQSTTVSYSTTGTKTITLTSANGACGVSASSTESVDVDVTTSAPPANSCTQNASNQGSTAGAGSTYGIGITEVSFLGVTRASGDSSDDDIAYEDMTCSHIGTTTGASFDIDVSVSTSSNAYDQQVRVFLDANNDGFTANEDLVANESVVTAGSTQTYNIPIPAGAVTGQLLRLRVSVDYKNTNRSACQDTQFGQVEDYSVFIDAPVPVTLASLTTDTRDDDVTVAWSVGEEIDVEAYYVQTSGEDGAWVGAGTVPATGAPQYAFADLDKAPGRHYYRLVTVDRDGTRAISDVVSARVRSATEASALRVAPNPAQSGRTAVTLPADGIDYAVTVVDPVGRVVMTHYVGARDARRHTLDFSGLPRGIYTVSARSDESVLATRIVH